MVIILFVPTLYIYNTKLILSHYVIQEADRYIRNNQKLEIDEKTLKRLKVVNYN